MDDTRGPDYADELTESERQTLTTLLAHVSDTRATPVARRTWRAPVAAATRRTWRAPVAVAAAVVLVLLAVGSVRFFGAGSPPGGVSEPPGAEPPPSPAQVLDDLATAAATASAASARSSGRTLEVVVVRCRLSAVSVETWVTGNRLSVVRARP